MATKADRTIVEALGVPGTETTKLEWSTGTQVSGLLTANTTYRFGSDDNLYFRLVEENDETLVDTEDTFLFSATPEIFQTDGAHVHLTVSGENSTANLWATPMKQPAK